MDFSYIGGILLFYAVLIAAVAFGIGWFFATLVF